MNSFMSTDLDINQTLDELESVNWGEPDLESSVGLNCHRLRKVSLKHFTTEDLRLMIGQNISLEYLIPLAIQRLKSDPLLEGSFYPGDLLVNILKADPSYWINHSELCSDIIKIASRGIEMANHFSKMECNLTIEPLTDAFKRFQKTGIAGGQ
jgi:hypothetical protein